MPVTSSGVSRCGCPSILHVLEAVRGVSRFERVAVTAGRDHAVDLADGSVPPWSFAPARWSWVTSPLGVECFAVHERELGVRRAEVGEADPAVDVLAEVDDLAVGVEPADGDGSQLLRRAESAGPVTT